MREKKVLSVFLGALSCVSHKHFDASDIFHHQSCIERMFEEDLMSDNPLSLHAWHTHLATSTEDSGSLAAPIVLRAFSEANTLQLCPTFSTSRNHFLMSRGLKACLCACSWNGIRP